MLKREVWNKVSTPPWRGLRLLLFALAIMLIASSVGELKKTQGQSSSTCNITYQETTFWPTGFQGQVTIRNNGPAINGWTLAFTFPTTTQVIYELWNGVYTQTGQNVTVNNASNQRHSYRDAVVRGYRFESKPSGNGDIHACQLRHIPECHDQRR